MLRVQLINDNIGVLDINQVDPGGLANFEVETKRSKDHDGVFYEFGVNLEFNKASRSFVKRVYESEGIEGVIVANIYEYDPNNYNWYLAYSGKIKLDNYELSEVKLTTSVEQKGFERKFLNMLKRDVDIESYESLNGVSLSRDNSINLPLAPKTIKRKAVIQGDNKWIESGYTPGFASIIRLGGAKSNSDFENTFIDLDGWFTPDDFTEVPPDTKNYIIKAPEAGNYVFDFSNFNFGARIAVGKIADGVANLVKWQLKLMYQKNDEAPVEIWGAIFPDEVQFDSNYEEIDTEEGIQYRFTKNNIQVQSQIISDFLKVGDEIYVWFDSDVDFSFSGTSSKNVAYRLNSDSFNFSISADTIFPQTSTKAFMVYEFMERICQYVTDQRVAFVSQFFGRTDLGYDSDGPGSMIAIANGANIRNKQTVISKTDQVEITANISKTFGNWEDVYSSLNSIYCLGWGFEYLEDGTQVVRVEPKEYFFNANDNILSLGYVSDLKLVAVRDLYYQNIEVGYPEVENINQVNGIDEFNSLRKWSSPISSAKGDLKIISKYRASGFEIESQRRLLGTTKESKLDDHNFFICVKRSGSGFVVQQGGDFEYVTGLYDPDTAYNIAISPGRMLRNWEKVLASNTLRSYNKTFKFTYGSFNYQMASKYAGENEVNESGDVKMNDSSALWYNEEYHFETKLVKSQRYKINDNPRGCISALDWDGVQFKGYISSVKSILENNKSNMELRRVYDGGN